MNEDIETRIEELFGNSSRPFKEKYSRQKEYLKRTQKNRG